VLSVCGGFISLKSFYHDWAVGVVTATGQLGVIPPLKDTGAFLEMIVPSAFVVIGVITACSLYWEAATDPLDIKILANKFYLDEFYDRSLVGGQQMTARLFNWFDSWILDGLVIRGAAYISVGVGEILRLFQTGSLQTYAFLFSLGGLAVIYFTLFGH
jgi:NADH-quinone oxidoreductase subunit L